MHYRKDRGFDHGVASEITPRGVYEGRRDLLKLIAAGGGMALGPWALRDAMAQTARPGKLAALPGTRSAIAGGVTMEKVTSYTDITSYNNYYEFGTDKAEPAQNAGSLKTRPWTVAIEGEVKKPKVYDIDELLKLSAMEERIYRMRHESAGPALLRPVWRGAAQPERRAGAPDRALEIRL
jgi:methionine sulfoxide reductase catalytic subunit